MYYLVTWHDASGGHSSPATMKWKGTLIEWLDHHYGHSILWALEISKEEYDSLRHVTDRIRFN